ncbi:MAG: peptidylprolyl isomerase [Terracidiphilus sp.]
MRRLPSNPVRLALALGLAAAMHGQSAPPGAPEPVPSVAKGQVESQNPAPPADAQLLDRVVAVVNNQAILWSDVDLELRLAVLDPAQTGLGVLTPRRALEQLIERALIQQQIRSQEAQADEPAQAELDQRLSELRRELPACVHANCATPEGWRAFLAAHGLTPERVERRLRDRSQILRFIEQRFRQGIQIAPQEIETFYLRTLLPQYAPGETIPPLAEVSQRIEEVLLEREVNVLFDDWLNNLRKQGDVEILDPDLEGPAAPPPSPAPAMGKEVRP